MPESSLFSKNLVFLDSADPGFARMVRATGDTLTRCVPDEGGRAVDIDLGSGRLYNRPADDFAAEQVASWARRPMRVVFNPPVADDLKDGCTRALSARLEAEGEGRLLAVPPADEAGMLVVVGLGLGAHVERLIERTGPRHVVLIEPIEEFAAHSLRALDWAALHARCRAAGATIDTIFHSDPREVQKRLEAVITRNGASSTDGAYLYVHYRTEATAAIARGFQELAGMKAIMQGYFDDERLMIENTVANVARDFWMVDGAFRAPRDLPAIVVGSGPSLDASLEALRAWQGHAVIFCAGSALQTLLGAGIRPDFQVEKENNATTEARMHHIFGRVRDRLAGGTFGVDLIASTSVKPSILDLFDDTFLFHREELSSTRMFARGHRPVTATGPFSANTALSLATTLGFRRIYLFGCDCGSVDRDRHHAADTVYNTREGHAQGHAHMPIRVPANFGGEAWSNSYYLWSRWVFESMIAGAGIDAVNCSDGVAIAGARPVRPEALFIPGKPLDKAAVAAAIKAQCRRYEAGTYLARQDMAGVRARWRTFAGEFRAFLDDALSGAGELYEFERRLAAFLDAADRRHGGIPTPVSGSARSMVPVAGYYVNRAADDVAEARLMAAFREVYRAQVERVLDECTALLDECAGRAAAAAGPAAPIPAEDLRVPA